MEQIVWIRNIVAHANGTQSLREYVAMVRQRTVEIFGITIMYASAGRRRRMINQIEDMRKKIDELDYATKKKSDENESLKAENKALKQRIKDLEDVLDSKYYTAEESELNKLIVELQDQHQQDCIRINDLTTTVHVLAGLYSLLRKNVGMD